MYIACNCSGVWLALGIAPGAGGGALRYRMGTHCQTAARSGSGEHQNVGAVNSFEGKKRGAVNFKLGTK